MIYRRECGELINADSWVMRNLWDSTNPKGKGFGPFMVITSYQCLRKVLEFIDLCMYGVQYGVQLPVLHNFCSTEYCTTHLFSLVPGVMTEN